MRYRALLLLPLFITIEARADTLITREYQLRNADASNVIQILNFIIPNPTGKRIISGHDKKLVVTDAVEPQDSISDMLPILDQSSTEKDARKIQMEMLVRASRYLQQSKKTLSTTQNSTALSVPKSDPSIRANSYDKFLSTQPYKSVYSDEDAKLTQGPRILQEEPTLLSLSSLTLKGIFMTNTKSPLALLSFEGVNYTARDGGLFSESNRTRLKGVTLSGPKRFRHLNGT